MPNHNAQRITALHRFMVIKLANQLLQTSTCTYSNLLTEHRIRKEKGKNLTLCISPAEWMYCFGRNEERKRIIDIEEGKMERETRSTF